MSKLKIIACGLLLTIPTALFAATPGSTGSATVPSTIPYPSMPFLWNVVTGKVIQGSLPDNSDATSCSVTTANNPPSKANPIIITCPNNYTMTITGYGFSPKGGDGWSDSNGNGGIVTRPAGRGVLGWSVSHGPTKK